jgi:transcriptional regulator of arginine metabolism
MHMVHAKAQRHRAIAELLGSESIGSQDVLARRLSDCGFEVTQATVSRDLVDIGAVKVRRSGTVVYATPIAATAVPEGPRYETLIAQYGRSIATAMNLVVIRTPPGTAHLIGVALDRSPVDGIAGNICGDDTIFIACDSIERATALAKRLREA